MGFSCGLSNSGLGRGTWETGKILTETHQFQIRRVCSVSRGSSRYPEEREGGWEALGRWGIKGKQRARTVPSLQFGLVRAESQLASLGLDEKRAGMRRAHACTYQQM